MTVPVFAFNMDDSLLISGHATGIIKIWEIDNLNKLTNPISVHIHEADITSIAVSKLSNWFVSGGCD